MHDDHESLVVDFARWPHCLRGNFIGQGESKIQAPLKSGFGSNCFMNLSATCVLQQAS